MGSEMCIRDRINFMEIIDWTFFLLARFISNVNSMKVLYLVFKIAIDEACELPIELAYND